MTTSSASDGVWARLGGDLRQFIRRRVADDHLADDLLQETFLRIHRGIGALDDAERLAAWVYRIARNVIHDHYRQTSRATVPLANHDPADDAEADRLDQLRCNAGLWVDEFVRQLPDNYRQAVQLAEIEGLPQQEVADRLGLSLSAAKSRIQRGRAMLKDLLDLCCSFQYDQRGNVMDYDPRPDRTTCRDCGE